MKLPLRHASHFGILPAAPRLAEGLAFERQGRIMIRYTVLIPWQDASESVTRLIAQLDSALERLVLPYEMILIDDASADSSGMAAERLLEAFASLRLLRFDEPRGLSAALSAGIAAARGDLVIGWGASSRVEVRYLPQLISRLSKHDFVAADLERSIADELRAAVASVCRWFGAGAQLRREGTLCWAARREALSGVTLGRGAFRALPAIVARRGYRVCRLLLAEGLPPRGRDLRLGQLKRWTTGWIDRRFEPHLASEVPRTRIANSAEPRRDAARAYRPSGPQFIEIKGQRDE